MQIYYQTPSNTTWRLAAASVTKNSSNPSYDRFYASVNQLCLLPDFLCEQSDAISCCEQTSIRV